jgi:hypothetical protein
VRASCFSSSAGAGNAEEAEEDEAEDAEPLGGKFDERECGRLLALAAPWPSAPSK